MSAVCEARTGSVHGRAPRASPGREKVTVMTESTGLCALFLPKLMPTMFTRTPPAVGKPLAVAMVTFVTVGGMYAKGTRLESWSAALS